MKILLRPKKPEGSAPADPRPKLRATESRSAAGEPKEARGKSNGVFVFRALISGLYHIIKDDGSAKRAKVCILFPNTEGLLEREHKPQLNVATEQLQATSRIELGGGETRWNLSRCRVTFHFCDIDGNVVVPGSVAGKAPAVLTIDDLLGHNADQGLLAVVEMTPPREVETQIVFGTGAWEASPILVNWRLPQASKGSSSGFVEKYAADSLALVTKEVASVVIRLEDLDGARPTEEILLKTSGGEDVNVWIGCECIGTPSEMDLVALGTQEHKDFDFAAHYRFLDEESQANLDQAFGEVRELPVPRRQTMVRPGDADSGPDLATGSNCGGTGGKDRSLSALDKAL